MRPSAWAARVRALHSCAIAHSASPRNSRGAWTPSPAASTASSRFNGDSLIDNAQPEIAGEAQRREIVGEQAVQRIHAEARSNDVEAARALVGLKRRRVARIEADPHALDDRLGQRRDVAQAEVEPLPRQRMDDVGGVGDQRQPLGDEAPREAERERNRFDARGEAQRAELQVKRYSSSRRKSSGASAAIALASAWRSFQTMLEKRPRIGRMANGPPGRKCCSARPSWSRSWAIVATMPVCRCPSRRSEPQRARAAASARRRRRRRAAS